MSRDEIQDFEDLSSQGKCLSIADMRKRIHECEKIEDFMTWNIHSGEYEPSQCVDCHFPKLAHNTNFAGD